jgi:AcrR family transcriptional regulator
MSHHLSEDIRKQQLLDSARRCIARQGYHQTTMDEIAQEAGLSKGALYWYFKSKDEIFIALCNFMCNEHLELLKQLTEQKMSIRELAFVAGDKFLELMTDESEHYKVFFEFWSLADENEEIKKAFGTAQKTWHETIANLISWGIQRGEIKSGINVSQLSIALMSIFDGIMVEYAFNKSLDIKNIWRTIVSALFDGIAK